MYVFRDIKHKKMITQEQVKSTKMFTIFILWIFVFV